MCLRPEVLLSKRRMESTFNLISSFAEDNLTGLYPSVTLKFKAFESIPLCNGAIADRKRLSL